MEGVSVEMEKKKTKPTSNNGHVFVGELPSTHTLSYNIPHSWKALPFIFFFNLTDELSSLVYSNNMWLIINHNNRKMWVKKQ